MNLSNLSKRTRQERLDYIEASRRRQPIEELKRKADKAACKGHWTQEDLDWSMAEGKRLYEALQLNCIVWE